MLLSVGGGKQGRAARLISGAVSLLLIGPGLAVSTAASPALAAPNVPVTKSAAVIGSDFRPGLIISDALFYDGAAMTAAEIQQFLDSKIGTCLNGNCLNVATINYPGRNREVSTRTGNVICEAVPAGVVRASELIYRAQVACGISAKVILATLQKEQGLVLKNAPTDYALRWAMGMACPDTAPCDTAFAGLGTQIVAGTRQLKVYRAAAFARQPGTHFIGWSPNSSCGGTYVDIQNFATAALYNYTPYQPNAAALANLGGVGDSCSSYGNRNFWWFYSMWFGSTIDLPCTVNQQEQIAAYWESQGGSASALGNPVSPGFFSGARGIVVGTYQNADVYCVPRIGPVAVDGDFRTLLSSQGGVGGPLGAPTQAARSFSANGITGRLQVFEFGTVLSSATTGTHAVLDGPIRVAWGDRGGSGGSLGWPLGSTEIVAIGLAQRFQGGYLVVPTGQSPIVLAGEVGPYWSSGSNASRLGSPTGSAAAWSAGGVSGVLQYFQRGMVLSSSTTGTFSVLDGPIRNAWGARGGTGGALGWPIRDQEVITGGLRQEFQRGMIVVLTNGTTAVLSGEIGRYWSSGSNASRLGAPTSSASAWTAGGVTGTLQYFQRGMVLSSASTGTWAVLNGPIRDAWGARGGSGGALGWPIGDQETVGGEVRQQFQRGTIVGSTSSTLYPIEGAIAAYWSEGSNRTLLGAPTGVAVSVSGGGFAGQSQSFQRGIVLSSAQTGTYAVLTGALRTAWNATGGVAGPLGWPTASQESVGSDLRQTFSGGLLTVTAQGAATTVTGSFFEYWGAGSNAATIGAPLDASMPWAAGGVTGALQNFERALVMSSSATGTYAVLHGPIRDVWGSLGGSGGTLGWPVGDQIAADDGVRQAFQNGTVVVPSSGTPYVEPN